MLLQKGGTRKSYRSCDDDIIKQLADLKMIISIFKKLEIRCNQTSKIN